MPLSLDQAKISIHAPLAGCDGLPAVPGQGRERHFNPRTPCGVRRTKSTRSFRRTVFQSTHPLRGATMATAFITSSAGFQSTHPLRGATFRIKKAPSRLRFQSTHPLRGATLHRPRHQPRHGHFNPRTPCGVRPIYAHKSRSTKHFNPRTPCGVRPGEWITFEQAKKISIHAPLAGCDFARPPIKQVYDYFKPRTTCGVRLARPHI